MSYNRIETLHLLAKGGDRGVNRPDLKERFLTDIADLTDLVREAALDLKAEDVIVLPLDGRTIVADNFVIATGRSKVQTRSIADAVVQKARDAGFAVARTEGYNDGGWILIDLGPVVVHVFTPDQRAFYHLERLWGTVETPAGPQRMRVRTKRERALRENFKRAAVWVLLICFVASIAGLTLVTFAAR